jgi:hypothetical protein
MNSADSGQPDHWLALESDGSGGPWGCRIESVGVKLPALRLTTRDPIAALQAAVKSGRLGEARNTLMLAAGAGITIALAAYRQTPR